MMEESAEPMMELAEPPPASCQPPSPPSPPSAPPLVGVRVVLSLALVGAVLYVRNVSATAGSNSNGSGYGYRLLTKTTTRGFMVELLLVWLKAWLAIADLMSDVLFTANRLSVVPDVHK